MISRGQAHLRGSSSLALMALGARLHRCRAPAAAPAKCSATRASVASSTRRLRPASAAGVKRRSCSRLWMPRSAQHCCRQPASRSRPWLPREPVAAVVPARCGADTWMTLDEA
eukprot:3048919-Prymnesium_polylepis.1